MQMELYTHVVITRFGNDTVQNGMSQRTIFTDNGIKIVAIASGDSHNLALDENGKVYTWGCIVIGDYVMTPKLVDTLKEYKWS